MHLPDTSRAQGNQDRLLYLDAMRGLAALVVAVIFHYVHFASRFQPDSLPLSAAPGYDLPLLHSFYKNGYLAVDIFFVISGLIFSHVYADSIKAGAVSGRDFVVRRIARLYPLHLATLLAAAVLAYAFQAMSGQFPVYQWNDLHHFVLNLLFVQYGFLEQGYSFNGPAWSLAVEALAYLVFFVVARSGMRLSMILTLFAIGLAMFIAAPQGKPAPLLWSADVGRGIAEFLAGLLIQRYGPTKPVIVAGALIAVGLLGYFPLGPLWRIKAAGPAFVVCACFGLVLLALQRWPVLRAPLETRPFLILGDLSLGIYLLHFPIQVLIMLACTALSQPIPFASSAFLFTYGALVLTAAWITHHHFELPAQRWVRQRLATRRLAAATK